MSYLYCAHESTVRLLAGLWKCSKCGMLLRNNVEEISPEEVERYAKIRERREARRVLFASGWWRRNR